MRSEFTMDPDEGSVPLGHQPTGSRTGVPPLVAPGYTIYDQGAQKFFHLTFRWGF